MRLYWAIFFSCIFVVHPAFSQMFNNNFVSLSLGSVLHTVNTISQTGKITGCPTADILPDINFSHYFSQHTALCFGLQNPSLATKFKIDQNSAFEQNESKQRSLTNKSGYLKFYCSYNYALSLSKKLNLIFGVGPYLTYSKVLGLDDNQTFYASSTAPAYTVNYATTYEVYKVKRWVLAYYFLWS